MKEQVHTAVSTDGMPLYTLLANLRPRSSIETVWRVPAHGRTLCSLGRPSVRNPPIADFAQFCTTW